MKISAIIPTHNPRVDLLREVVASVAAQSTPADTWELLIVDNASNPALRTLIDFPGLNSTKILEESALGLTYARLKGIRESRGDYIVFIDDDTILDSTYFQHVVEFFEEHPAVSIIGGAITARLDCEPPPWFQEFSSNLALRDLGRDIQIFQASYDSHQRLLYPLAAPVGAGMALRKTTAESYAHSLTESTSFLSDRKGTDLSSAGDCEIVIGALSSGKAVAYVPKLKLTHVIPSHRLRFSYFARLRYSIGRSWVHLLYQYAASPWPPLDRAALPLSLGRSFFRMKAWSCKTRFVEWAYFAGQLRGRADYAHYTRLSKICAHVTMGKLLYRTYYQPLHSVKRIIAQGIARSFEQLKNESEMKQKVHTLRSVQPCPEPGLPVHFLSGSKFWEQTCLCFASLAKVSPITLHPIIIDDGTLRRSHRKSIKTVLP
ncbi:MAG: glycosyltransferase family 2 protein, partial [Bdellovibrionales bacterium]|nr:glycosyltransferase family 2 protein [Bdellovibrionales bacterium]